MAVVEKAVGNDALLLAKILVRMRGVNRIDGHVVLLAIGGSVHRLGVAFEEAANGQLAGQGHHGVVGPTQVIEREVPIDRVLQGGQRHVLGGVGHARQPQVAAVRHEAREEDPFRGPGRPITRTPMGKAVGEVALLVNGMQHLVQ